MYHCSHDENNIRHILPTPRAERVNCPGMAKPPQFQLNIFMYVALRLRSLDLCYFNKRAHLCHRKFGVFVTFTSTRIIFPIPEPLGSTSNTILSTKFLFSPLNTKLSRVLLSIPFTLQPLFIYYFYPTWFVQFNKLVCFKDKKRRITYMFMFTGPFVSSELWSLAHHSMV